MIRPQHVDGLVVAPGDQLVVMVGDIRHHIGEKAVGTPQHEILVRAEIGGLEPDGAFAFVGIAPRGQQLHHLGGLPVFVEGGFPKPAVVMDAVGGQIPLEAGHVQRQGVIHQGLAALLLRRIHIAVAVDGREGLGVLHNILAVIAVLRHLDPVPVKLEIPQLQGHAEFIDLVAGVVDIEFPADLVAGALQHSGQAVTDGPAPGVADVHGAGGVGGDELYQHLFPLAVVGTAVIRPLGQHVGHRRRVKGRGQEEVEEAGARHLRPLEEGTGQIQMSGDGFGDFPRGLAEGAGGHHGHIGGQIAVTPIRGDFNDKGGNGLAGQLAGGHGLPQGGEDGLPQLFVCLRDDSRHLVFLLLRRFLRGKPANRRPPPEERSDFFKPRAAWIRPRPGGRKSVRRDGR